MRFAVLADIHGNLPALEAVLDDLSSHPAVDQILVAGDSVSGCPYPRETIALLRERNCRCIRGNNETYILNMHTRACHPDVLTNRQWAATRWAFEQLNPAELAWVASLPAQLSLPEPGGGLRVLHGSLEGESISLVPDRNPGVIRHLEASHLLRPGQPLTPLSVTLASIPESVLIAGHIHTPWLQREGAKLALNPGSVGMPIHGDPRACYVLLEWDGLAWQVELRAVAYDRARVKRAFQTSGLLAAGGGFARGCLVDLDRAQNTVWMFVEHAFATARARGHHGPIIPDPLWLEAEATFDWDRLA